MSTSATRPQESESAPKSERCASILKKLLWLLLLQPLLLAVVFAGISAVSRKLSSEQHDFFLSYGSPESASDGCEYCTASRETVAPLIAASVALSGQEGPLHSAASEKAMPLPVPEGEMASGVQRAMAESERRARPVMSSETMPSPPRRRIALTVDRSAERASWQQWRGRWRVVTE
jgi:hypothetical protein